MTPNPSQAGQLQPHAEAGGLGGGHYHCPGEVVGVYLLYVNRQGLTSYDANISPWKGKTANYQIFGYFWFPCWFIGCVH